MAKKITLDSLLFTLSILAFVGITYVGSSSQQLTTIPEEAKVYNARGLNYYAEAKFELEATRKFSEATTRYEMAAEAFEKAIAIAPSYMEAHRNLGRVYIFQKRFPEAVREYEAVVDILPDDIDARADLAAAYEKTNRYSDAIRQLQIAISLSSDELSKEMIKGTIERIEKKVRQ